MTPVDDMDLYALNTLVAWQKEDPGARSFRVHSHREFGETEWKVSVHSTRWRGSPDSERDHWHADRTLSRAISNAVDDALRGKR